MGVPRTPCCRVSMQSPGKNPMSCCRDSSFPISRKNVPKWVTRASGGYWLLLVFRAYLAALACQQAQCTRVGVAEERLSCSSATPTACCRPVPMCRAGSQDRDSAPLPAFVEVRVGLRAIHGTNPSPTPLWRVLGVDWCCWCGQIVPLR